jgi:hypothetical protein
VESYGKLCLRGGAGITGIVGAPALPVTLVPSLTVHIVWVIVGWLVVTLSQGVGGGGVGTDFEHICA